MTENSDVELLFSMLEFLPHLCVCTACQALDYWSILSNRRVCNKHPPLDRIISTTTEQRHRTPLVSSLFPIIRDPQSWDLCLRNNFTTVRFLLEVVTWLYCEEGKMIYEYGYVSWWIFFIFNIYTATGYNNRPMKALTWQIYATWSCCNTRCHFADGIKRKSCECAIFRDIHFSRSIVSKLCTDHSSNPIANARELRQSCTKLMFISCEFDG